MKKILSFIFIIIAIIIVLFFVFKRADKQYSESLIITYPYNNAVFPADITAPTIYWQEENEDINNWEISIAVANSIIIESTKISNTNWRPTESDWKTIIEKSIGKKLTVIVCGSGRKYISKDTVTILISTDKVKAPIFFRSVPLPFKFARENLKNIRWHIGEISNENKPHIVLENIPVCANCHSFTPDGKTIAMDVDARDDKGAFAISTMKQETLFAEDSLIHWSDSQNGKFTYGLLSQISPDGRYVVSTLKDCEIFVDRKDLEYSQLFFPIKGILVIYDRLKKEYFELEGANDTMLIQSNPCWSPDGKFIYFTQARAKHYEESGLHNGSIPKAEDVLKYKEFESKYLSRDSLMKFNIYKIPFKNGKGGKAIPVPGASHNGLSNYFPKISPDGKWMVFCQAESFMLLQKDSKLNILLIDGGEPRQMTCNTDNMNSWHSWSPNGKWLVFSTKAKGPYTQLFLTHINSDGTDSPPVHLEKFSFKEYANNIPEFVNTEYNSEMKINPTFLSDNDFIVRLGEIKQREGDIAGAFESYNKAIKEFSNESEPYYKRGVLYFQKNEMLPAIEDLSRAISIDKIPQYYTYRGLAYFKLKVYFKVIDDLTVASKLDPSSFTPFAYLGVACLRTGKFSKAIETLGQAIKLFDKDAFTFYYLGLANYSVKNWAEANKAFTSAINLDIENTPKMPVNALRGESRFYLSEYNNAIKDLKIALTLTPDDSELLFLLGKAELEIGKRKDANENLVKAKELGSVKAEEILEKLNSR